VGELAWGCPCASILKDIKIKFCSQTREYWNVHIMNNYTCISVKEVRHYSIRNRTMIIPRNKNLVTSIE
jgi:hypothetical protein